jgi:hypothetical protein
MPGYKAPAGAAEPLYHIVYAIVCGLLYWAAGMLVLAPPWWFAGPRAKCPSCGSEVSARDLNCPRCGRAIQQPGPVLLSTTSPPAHPEPVEPGRAESDRPAGSEPGEHAGPQPVELDGLAGLRLDDLGSAVGPPRH